MPAQGTFLSLREWRSGGDKVANRVTVVWRRELGVLALNWTDVADGAIANAAWGVVSMVAKPRTARQVAANLDTAAWADTERLIRDALAEIEGDASLPELSAEEVAGLEAAVRAPETQGALQALLAARLTDAPETDAARAREAVRLAIEGFSGEPVTQQANPASGSRPSDRRRPGLRDLAPVGSGSAAARYSGPLSEYFDEKISTLVAMLEGRVGFAGLAQVRAEAYNARIVALLGAIERQVAALADPSRGAAAEAEFLQRYRRQAHQRHGFLTPPDFDRRRRVPIADIYVPTGISEEDRPERLRLTPGMEPGSLNVWDLAGRLDRTVLLGDPGGGKTTAANVLTDRFAADGSPRIAFLVTLREYAAKTPIEWSVAKHIEHNLSTLYQSPAPGGLVERLLLTGRAVVIFDGLDELLDTSRRRDVSDRVEQFCSAYPLAPVLVTSRMVGYDQARLDDTQFTCYRLGGFGDDEVAGYAGKWFRNQEGLASAEAEAKAQAFLTESAHATDLRANPLLLSLMCILYRGAGSLPGDRAGIYARCAELLLRKWDEQRDLYRKLGSDHLVEPTLRYLAWWLFIRENGRTAATERELTAKAAEFLYERGYETEEQASAAAREFVAFCRGRMWVFSDAGTTADGETLYGFTHRTFMEYFAAWHLAVTFDSPEDLARTLLPRLQVVEWEVVCELAIQLKDSSSNRGADRIYAVLLDAAAATITSGADEDSIQASESVLSFLAKCLESAKPSPATVRQLTRKILDYFFGLNATIRSAKPSERLTNCAGYQQLVAEEIASRIASAVASDDRSNRLSALKLALEIRWTEGPFFHFWQAFSQRQADIYAAEVLAESVGDGELRVEALHCGLMSIEQVLAMPNGFVDLVGTEIRVEHVDVQIPYLIVTYLEAAEGGEDRSDKREKAIDQFNSVGQYFMHHQDPPWGWINGETYTSLYPSTFIDFVQDESNSIISLAWNKIKGLSDEVSFLGVTVTACALIELAILTRSPDGSHSKENTSRRELIRCFTGQAIEAGWELPDLPLPAAFRQVFRDWADGRVNFIEIIGSPGEDS